jgi:MFS family permease
VPRANALESMTYGLADVAGPALAGALAAAFGAPAALGGQIALAALCLALLALLRPAAPPPPDARPRSLGAALAAGVRALLRAPALRGVTTASPLGSVSAGLLTVALPALAERLTGDASAAGGLYAAIAAGAIGGAALLARLPHRVAAERLVYASGAAQGVVFVALGALPVSPADVRPVRALRDPPGPRARRLFAVRIECTPVTLRSQVFTSVAGRGDRRACAAPAAAPEPASSRA